MSPGTEQAGEAPVRTGAPARPVHRRGGRAHFGSAPVRSAPDRPGPGGLALEGHDRCFAGGRMAP